jgi:aspartate aminotransferase-like enzyme
MDVSMKRVKKMMMAGPVDLHEDVRVALAEQPLASWHDDFVPVYVETLELLKRVFATSGDIILLTSPGSGSVEACVTALFAPGERVVAGVNGFFSERMVDVMKTCGIDVIVVPFPWGMPVDPAEIERVVEKTEAVAGVAVLANETGSGVRNPVKEIAQVAHRQGVPIFVDAVSAVGGYELLMDAWELDVVAGSSNKALEIPPGIGLAAVSSAGWRIIEEKQSRTRRGWYLDLLRWKKGLDTRPNRPYQITLASSLIAGLRASLNRIVNEEGVQGHWARYASAQRVVRAGVKALGFELLVSDEWASPVVTAVSVAGLMDHPRELVSFMEQEHDILITTGAGRLAESVFRIGHMGLAATPEYYISCLLGIEDFLRRVKGRDIRIGTSLIGMEQHG